MNGSPEQRYDHSSLRISDGSSPSNSPPANRSNLSTASPPYMTRTSPTGFPRTSPPHFTDTSPMALCSMYLRCISPSSYSATSPRRYSSISPPDLSSGSPPGPSSLDSGTHSQSTDSDFLNLAVALRNMEVELNKHITENPSCENGNGSPGRESVRSICSRLCVLSVVNRLLAGILKYIPDKIMSWNVTCPIAGWKIAIIVRMSKNMSLLNWKLSGY